MTTQSKPVFADGEKMKTRTTITWKAVEEFPCRIWNGSTSDLDGKGYHWTFRIVRLLTSGGQVFDLRRIEDGVTVNGLGTFTKLVHAQRFAQDCIER